MEKDTMRDGAFSKMLLFVAFLVPKLALSQVPRQNGTLSVTGYSGQVPVIQVNGRSYVAIESLARLTSGSMSFRGKQIVLTLSPPATNPASPEANQAVESGFSKEFLRASIEEMTAIWAWRSAIADAIQNSFAATGDWVASYIRSAQDKLALASAATATDSDRRGFALLSNELGKMQALSDKYLGMRNKLNYIAPDLLENDPLDQQILNCARGLSSFVASGQFEDVPACH